MQKDWLAVWGYMFNEEIGGYVPKRPLSNEAARQVMCGASACNATKPSVLRHGLSGEAQSLGAAIPMGAKGIFVLKGLATDMPSNRCPSEASIKLTKTADWVQVQVLSNHSELGWYKQDGATCASDGLENSELCREGCFCRSVSVSDYFVERNGGRVLLQITREIPHRPASDDGPVIKTVKGSKVVLDGILVRVSGCGKSRSVRLPE
jgi:hypothetical protein